MQDLQENDGTNDRDIMLNFLSCLLRLRNARLPGQTLPRVECKKGIDAFLYVFDNYTNGAYDYTQRMFNRRARAQEERQGMPQNVFASMRL